MLLPCSMYADTGTSATWPRAFVLDLICDETATDSKPVFIAEHPTYTYKGAVALELCTN